MTLIIMRRPVLLEDEGRHFFIKSCSTQQEAQEWIDNQAGEYFRPHDYYIAEVST